jgi:pilus assembly protein FimV
MPSRATALILVCASAALAPGAWALGFGRLNASAVLGQPLNLPVPLHLEAGERIEPECLRAEAIAGESQWGKDQLRVQLEPGDTPNAWVARIRSTPVVDEPVVEVTLTVGCERRFSRRFVAFADPPGLDALRRSPLPADVATAVAPAPTAPLPRRNGPTRAVRESSPESPPVRPRANPPAPAASRAMPRKPPRADAQVAAVQRRADSGHRLMLDVGGPRLKLDIEDPVFMPRGPAEGAASGVEDELSTVSEAQRLQALEKTLASLKLETESARQAAGTLKIRLAEAERGSRALPWVVALLMLASAVAIWLTWRLRRQQHQAAEAAQWWSPDQPGEPLLAETPGGLLETGQAPPATATPASRHLQVDELPGMPANDVYGEGAAGEATSPFAAALALERETAPPRGGAHGDAIQPPQLPEAPYERTMVIGGGGPAPFHLDRVTAEPPAGREVSVEELLDLEQQADFFLALGQEDAAVDLLMSHLRSTGGLSPLPYTKLLEIYRRQHDREAYERIRARFNRRFNAYAPDWDAGPLSGRALEDYPEVVLQLQALWPEPLDAMAALEAMLFRKDTGHELFDLPAYKDVLLLYSLARDLWQQQGGLRTSGVDVLLPLEDNPSAQAGAQVSPADEHDPPQFQLTAYSPPPPPPPSVDDADEADGPRR